MTTNVHTTLQTVDEDLRDTGDAGDRLERGLHLGTRGLCSVELNCKGAS